LDNINKEMDRRTFFQTTTLASLGALIVPASLLRTRLEIEIDYERRIIYVNKRPSSIQTRELYDAIMAIWDHEHVHPFERLNGLRYIQPWQMRPDPDEEWWDNDDPSKLKIDEPVKVSFYQFDL
jgi:hypothetical protein